MQLRVLSGSDVVDSVTMHDAIDAMRDGFAQLAEGNAVLPPRVGLETADGITLLMPGYLPRDRTAAAKLVSVYPANTERDLPQIHAVVLVIDPETGVPIALMDGTRLTALRTGAVGGLAADLLAREDAKVAAVFGAGVQARAQVDALMAVRPIERLAVCSRSAAGARAFADDIAFAHDVAVVVAGHPREALDGADVVIAATPSVEPVFEGSVVPGTHVTGVGSFTPEMRELPLEMILEARVVVDELEACKEEAGELIHAAQSGLWGWEHVHAELGQLVVGSRPGRRSPDEITFFKSVGLAVQDVSMARRVLDRANDRGLGTTVEL